MTSRATKKPREQKGEGKRGKRPFEM